MLTTNGRLFVTQGVAFVSSTTCAATRIISSTEEMVHLGYIEVFTRLFAIPRLNILDEHWQNMQAKVLQQLLVRDSTRCVALVNVDVLGLGVSLAPIRPGASCYQ
ncbi:hypothetical protein GGS20DRAFT_555313 [Poronia punctata]|nr:hypothetical protein GGS20DRAFT_555313 [Poronia punctata]